MGELFTKQWIKTFGVRLRLFDEFVEHVAERVEKEKTKSALELNESLGQILHEFRHFLFANFDPFLKYFNDFCFDF